MSSIYSECEQLVERYGIIPVCKNLSTYCIRMARNRLISRKDEQGNRLWTYYARKLEEII